MGLFSQLPEEPNEWAGLPSEPAHPESDAERLRDAAPVDVGGLGVGALGLTESAGGGVEGIVIPLTPIMEAPSPAEPESTD
ncbi:hypothetical protein ACI3KY_19380 [Microbacterium sp. ZW T2_14]|uniref:hypothetical protein n=1 Tax=Microbacterium sp. ZW T2_14 TaxID=3378079 RepID=UPI0038529548